MTLTASRDNTIYQSAPNNSAGGAAGIFVGTNAAGSPRRGLIAFDVAGIVPDGALIIGTQLTMYLGSAGGNAIPQPIGLHRLNASWGEGTAGSASPGISGGGNGFPASAGDATWSHRFFGSTAWTMSGATGDYNPVASTLSPVSNTIDGPTSWFASPAMRDDVQSWLNQPASNFGWALVNGNETSGQSVRVFYSSDATLDAAGAPLDPARRPTLTITYVIPEPATIVLLLICISFAWPRARH